ncbi:hypothetical protein PHYPSEUDO_006204 [Phytophthora pseudosyringae]|uniref:WRKY19-like zinc finger domain-containing protein n=1 Tax=Phytophthora pseudosyringae TaxID=221518 RepID=A0A8T1VM88_9STRA|nr:hypothetical protein PHYPSEUDO_006204 [Phytophthora pseudosyringae]
MSLGQRRRIQRGESHGSGSRAGACPVPPAACDWRRACCLAGTTATDAPERDLTGRLGHTGKDPRGFVDRRAWLHHRDRLRSRRGACRRGWSNARGLTPSGQASRQDASTTSQLARSSSSRTRRCSMSVKADISFLLNPQSSEGGANRDALTPPASPPSFQRLMALAQSPEATTTSSSLLLLSSCIAPLQKMSASKKAVVPQLALAALCEASSGDSSSGSDDEEAEAQPEVVAVKTTPAADKPKPHTKTLTRKRVRKNRNPPCQVEECKNIAVSRGCCVRHGGGSRCKIEGCPNRAKLYKLCFQHGGFKTCATEGCTRKSKRYGHCWSHGGGRICVIPNCDKVSTQGGLCWAHGGGNRCKLEGCTRRSYQKYGYYCVDHVSLNKGEEA